MYSITCSWNDTCGNYTRYETTAEIVDRQTAIEEYDRLILRTYNSTTVGLWHGTQHMMSSAGKLGMLDELQANAFVAEWIEHLHAFAWTHEMTNEEHTCILLLTCTGPQNRAIYDMIFNS
jgi:hypothetical protein